MWVAQQFLRTQKHISCEIYRAPISRLAGSIDRERTLALRHAVLQIPF
jgi:hypothetical protein